MEKLLAFMESLVEEALSVAELSRKNLIEMKAEGFYHRYSRLSSNVLRILEYASLDSHLKEAKAANGISSDETKAAQMAGVIGSAYDLMRNGFVGKIKFLLHADMFASMLEQAKALNEAGHLIPAAVLGRIIIEDWLRDQAEKAAIEIPEGAKASAVNDGLKKASIFPVPKWRQVQVMLDIGNAAAHGNVSEISETEVSKLLEFIEFNCT